jgi:hypothetical protein
MVGLAIGQQVVVALKFGTAVECGLGGGNVDCGSRRVAAWCTVLHWNRRRSATTREGTLSQHKRTFWGGRRTREIAAIARKPSTRTVLKSGAVTYRGNRETYRG